MLCPKRLIGPSIEVGHRYVRGTEKPDFRGDKICLCALFLGRDRSIIKTSQVEPKESYENYCRSHTDKLSFRVIIGYSKKITLQHKVLLEARVSYPASPDLTFQTSSRLEIYKNVIA